MTEPLSDGCTGFQWLARYFPGTTECCVEHDAGGSDGVLLDCLTDATPQVGLGGAVLIVLLVAVMRLCRPVYEWTQGERPAPWLPKRPPGER